MSGSPPPIPSPQLNYRTPVSTHARPVAFVPPLVASLFVYGELIVMFCIVMPRVEQIFKDFRTELPGITKLLLIFGRWFREGGWLLSLPLFVGVPIVLSLLIPRQDPLRGRHRFWRLFNITFAAMLLIAVLYALAALVPMVNLIQTVSSPKKP